MAQDLCLPSSHFLRRRRHLFLASEGDPCDLCPQQEDEHRLAMLTRRMARHLLLDDAEVGKEMPEKKAKGYLERGIILGSTKEPSSALYALPPEKNGALECVFDPTSARRKLQTAHFQHLKRLQAMDQNFRARQSKNRGCERGNGETRPLDLPPFAWPPPHPRRATLLGTSGGRKESIGTGVFLPRVAAAAKFEPRKKSNKFESLPLFVPKVAKLTASATDVVHHDLRRASTLNPSLNSDDDNHHHHHHHHHPDDDFLRAQPAAAAAAPVAAHEIELPQEWTY